MLSGFTLTKDVLSPFFILLSEKYLMLNEIEIEIFQVEAVPHVHLLLKAGVILATKMTFGMQD